MSHSYICCLLHVIFSTTERRPLIRPEIQNRLHAYIGGIARENDMPALAVGGATDHVHVLLSLSRTTAVAKAVQLIKGGSSKWLNDLDGTPRPFSWQEGYAAFSVSMSNREKVASYILRQAENHRRMTFAEELTKLLRVHGITEDLSRPSGTPIPIASSPSTVPQKARTVLG